MRPILGIPLTVGHLTMLQRALFFSVLAHIALGLAFSGVVVTRQIVRYVQQVGPMVPTVNLQLSREMEVRTQARQQITPLPMPEPAAIHAAEPMVHAPTPEPPLAVSPGIPTAQPGQMTIALPDLAPRLTLPRAADVPSIALTPLAPPLGPVVVTPLTPSPGGKNPLESGAVAGLVNEQLADPNPVAFGAALGPVAAPPASANVGSGDSRAGPALGGGIPGPYNALGSNVPGWRPPADSLPPAPLLGPTPPPISPPAAGLGQRRFEERQDLLRHLGGNAQTEAAVARALAFLAKTQEADGHWTKFDEVDKAGVGQTTAHDVGLTGLGVLVYLAADYTPVTPSIYQETTRKALAYLRAIEKPDGDLRNGGNMYDQAIGTLALAEAAALTRNAQTRDAALQGAQFIVAARNADGGWRYSPHDLFSDTSVLGWQVMALHSATRLGWQPPADLEPGALANIRSKSKGQSGMLTGYLTAVPTSAMTAEALYSRLLLHAPLGSEELAEANDYLLSKLPEAGKPNYYYWYYGSLGLVQLSRTAPEVWHTWNAHTAEALLALQVPVGSALGSWNSDGEWGDRGGRIYCTALAALTLEVYYRYPVTGSR